MPPRACARAVEPVLSAWYAIPTIMFYPVLLVLFGAGAGAIAATAVLLAAPAMIASTLSGLDRVPAVQLRTARALRPSPFQAALLVRLPSAAPYLVTGTKLVVAYAFIGVIASEFILSAPASATPSRTPTTTSTTPRCTG